MTDWTSFAALLGKHAKQDGIAEETILFGTGMNLSSIAFLEFVMDLEEDTGLDVDVDSLDAGIVTAGHLYARLFPGG